MTAEEAKQLMLEKTISISVVLTRVKSAAGNGNPYLLVWEYLTDDAIKILIELGYSVRRADGPAKEKLIEISWI